MSVRPFWGTLVTFHDIVLRMPPMAKGRSAAAVVMRRRVFFMVVWVGAVSVSVIEVVSPKVSFIYPRPSLEADVGWFTHGVDGIGDSE
jgi:uncharacterized membrane protein YwaF